MRCYAESGYEYRKSTDVIGAYHGRERAGGGGWALAGRYQKSVIDMRPFYAGVLSAKMRLAVYFTTIWHKCFKVISAVYRPGYSIKSGNEHLVSH